MEELRQSSQLIVITHQKRTMEVADALYGVSMRGDGVTTVISQKLNRSESAPAPAKASASTPAAIAAPAAPEVETPDAVEIPGPAREADPAPVH